MIYRFCYRTNYPITTYLSLVGVIFGVVLATLGEVSSKTFGITLTLLGSLSAAMKTVVTNRLQTGGILSLSTLELFYRTGPLTCALGLIAGGLNGEMKRLWEGFQGQAKDVALRVLFLVVNAVMALALNIVSFSTNRDTSPLTMAVAANVKQVLSIVIGVVLDGERMEVVNVVGE